MVSSIGTRPYNSYLLIAGDTSSIFEFAAIFYNELIQWWNPNQIVVVPGNHELWDPSDEQLQNIYTIYQDNMKKIVEEYGTTPEKRSYLESVYKKIEMGIHFVRLTGK